MSALIKSAGGARWHLYDRNGRTHCGLLTQGWLGKRIELTKYAIWAEPVKGRTCIKCQPSISLELNQISAVEGALKP